MIQIMVDVSYYNRLVYYDYSTCDYSGASLNGHSL